MQHALEVAHRDLQTHERSELIISCHQDFSDYLHQVAYFLIQLRISLNVTCIHSPQLIHLLAE